MLGYYTISNSGVAFDVVPENLPRHPVPVALIGRLAVDITAESQTGRNTFDSCAAIGTARREDRWNLCSCRQRARRVCEELLHEVLL